MSFCCEIWRTPFGNQEVSIIGKVSAPERSRQIRREIPEYLSMRGRVLKYWLLTLLRECPSTEAGFHPMWAHVGTFKHQQCMSCLCFGVKSTHGTLGSLFYRFFLPKDAKTGGRFFRASLALETSSFTLSGSTDVSRRFFLSDCVSWYKIIYTVKFIAWDSTARKRMRKQRLGAEPQNLFQQWAHWDTLPVPAQVPILGRCTSWSPRE